MPRNNKASEMNLTLAEVKEYLNYDPDTGIFTWRKSRAKGRPIKGSVAGAAHNAGYIRLSINNTSYLAHRVAWFYVTGSWPKADIDHKDRNRKNNRFSNLREATRGENRYNSATSENKTGFVGITKLGENRYRARIIAQYRAYHLGVFPTLDEAHEAYQTAKQNLHTFARI